MEAPTPVESVAAAISTGLTSAAAILTTPAFQGFTISMLLGLAPSTLLTVVAIPAAYVIPRDADGKIS